MKDAAKNPAKHGRKTILFLLLLAAAAALIWTGLVIFKNKQTKEFLFQHNNEAKNMYNLLNTMMIEADTALPQGNYTGYGRIEGDTMTVTPDDSSIAPFTASTNGYYAAEKPYYFAYRMEDSMITQIRTSRRDVLRKVPETGHFDLAGGEKLTMAEYYLDTFVAYYP